MAELVDFNGLSTYDSELKRYLRTYHRTALHVGNVTCYLSGNTLTIHFYINHDGTLNKKFLDNLLNTNWQGDNSSGYDGPYIVLDFIVSNNYSYASLNNLPSTLSTVNIYLNYTQSDGCSMVQYNKSLRMWPSSNPTVDPRVLFKDRYPFSYVEYNAHV